MKEEIEILRIEIDRLIKQAEFGTALWHRLANAKEELGFALLSSELDAE